MKASYFALIGLLLFVLGCGVLAPSTPGAVIPPTGPTPTTEAQISITTVPPETAVPIVNTPANPIIDHLTRPSDSVPAGKLTFDVDSSGTAPEQRAPYGDSYQINRYERPFLQDMTYVPDLDIASYTVSSDSDWYYVSIALIGQDPNNSLGIHYGVEIDLDRDGYGDTLIAAQPPLTAQWDTVNVRVYADRNHDTGGSSSVQSDAPLTGDGYETLVFNGGAGDDDPDLAWARIVAGSGAQVQFAFKKTLGASEFMLGVLADGGLKDVTKMDYNDRFTIEEAGSPVRDNSNYPLKALFGIDNACRDGVGFNLSGNEPQGCPLTIQPPPPVNNNNNNNNNNNSCPAPPGCQIWDPVACVCNG